MSRIAVRSNLGTNSYGASRIPRPLGHAAPSHDGLMDSGRGREKPSRLQQLQADYQQRQMRDKESKMIEMYEQNQQRALQKVGHQKGMVRDFFNERRNQGSAGSSGGNSPSIEHAYKQKKMEHKVGQKHVNAFGYNTYSPQKPSTYKSSAGRDRANPLAPIQRPGQQSNPFPRKPQIVRPRTKDSSKNKENLSYKEPMPRSAPTGNFVTDNDNMSDDSPVPNAKQLEALQQKRKLLQSRKSNKSIVSVQSHVERPSDFQKWQSDQDQQRDDRLRRNREMNGGAHRSVEDEGYVDEDDDGMSKDDMRRKQAELMAQIEAQQRELNKIRQDRAREEAEEKKEMERRKRLEEERKRKQIEDEKRRRRQEEEDRIRREHEEERERKLQEEKRRLRQSSERQRFEYEQSDEEEMPAYHSNRNRKEPSPPPNPKPTKSVNRRHPVPAKTKTTPNRPPPASGGAHTALYEDADRLEGAIESVGNLRPCYNCGRKFAEDRIQKHESACKNATKKRKVLDPTKLRTRGTEMEQYVRHKQPEPKAKKSNWRTQHENFVQAIRYARKVKQIEEEGGNLADLPPPPATENPDYVQCQYCSRKFNAQAAERHIPHCKNARARPAAPPRKR